MTNALRQHGGPDAAGAARYDFSTNANACGPCPAVVEALARADAARYPDPTYTALLASLASLHDVDPLRIVIAGSASEFIYRITAWIARQGGRRVSVPLHAYGDYHHAARAWGLEVDAPSHPADLTWVCDPSSPMGVAADVVGSEGQVVLDCAYEPLRLSGASRWTTSHRQTVWQLFSPNKSLGLTGIRAAYAIAPSGQAQHAAALQRLAPSWVIGSHGVEMLRAWCHPSAKAWLDDSRKTLVEWKAHQRAMMATEGWHLIESETPFFCARPPEGASIDALIEGLRRADVKLRDATSFALPGWFRVSVQPPLAQQAFLQAWRLIRGGAGESQAPLDDKRRQEGARG